MKIFRYTTSSASSFFLWLSLYLVSMIFVTIDSTPVQRKGLRKESNKQELPRKTSNFFFSPSRRGNIKKWHFTSSRQTTFQALRRPFCSKDSIPPIGAVIGNNAWRDIKKRICFPASQILQQKNKGKRKTIFQTAHLVAIFVSVQSFDFWNKCKNNGCIRFYSWYFKEAKN